LEGIPIANDVDHEVPLSNVTSISLVEETHNFEDIIHVKNEEKAEDDVDDCYSCDDYYSLESNEEDDDLQSEEDDVVESHEDPIHDDRDFDDPELYIGRKFSNVVDLRFCLQQYGIRKNFNFKCIKNDIKRVTA